MCFNFCFLLVVLEFAFCPNFIISFLLVNLWEDYFFIRSKAYMFMGSWFPWLLSSVSLIMFWLVSSNWTSCFCVYELIIVYLRGFHFLSSLILQVVCSCTGVSGGIFVFICNKDDIFSDIGTVCIRCQVNSTEDKLCPAPSIIT